MTTLQAINASASPEIQANDNFESLSAAAIYGKRQPVTTGLTWGYYGGLYKGNAIADGTLTLTDNATNYIVVLRSTGVVSVSTSSSNGANALYAKLYRVITASSLATSILDQRMDDNGLLIGIATTTAKFVQAAVSDESTALTTGTSKVTFRMPHALNLSEVRASLNVAQASGSIFTVDINMNGSTVLSTKLTIDNTEKTSTTAATPAVIGTAALTDDAEITIDIDQVGAGSPAGLKILLIGT